MRDYRGLWGLDTHDVFGGERAPAGPRYERGGAVRASWADPLGWAGLQKEPPSEAAAAEDLRERVRALDARVEQLDQVIDVERTALRGTAAELRALEEHAGLQPHASVLRTEVRRAERDLAARYAERARLADAAAANREHLDRPPRPLAPDAHLRPSPAAADHRKRPRMLRVWGALSTPLLVGTIVVLLLGPPLAFLSSLVLFVVLFLGIEAAARARLLSFLVGLALTALTLALAAVLGHRAPAELAGGARRPARPRGPGAARGERPRAAPLIALSERGEPGGVQEASPRTSAIREIPVRRSSSPKA